MLILGCIKNISSLSLNVELPGRVFGKLQVNSISDTFTQLLTERFNNDSVDEDMELYTLTNIFEEGQFIPVKVIQIDGGNGIETSVILSMKPTDINVSYNHATFKKDMLMWAAVVEKSDHGYILDSGVRHTRVMLPFKNTEQEKLYGIGEPLWCVIKTIAISREASTITVSSLKKEIDSCAEVVEARLDELIPGMCVNFSAEETLKDGLEGKFFTNCTAYVNDIYLEKPLASKDKYIGEAVKAYVLYIQPTTKFTYLTLRNLQTVQKPKLPIGQILPAEVISRVGKGIIVKLNKKEKGFVTYRRILKALKLPETSDLEDVVRKKYATGSKHKCRILDYVHMDRLFICTFEQSVLKEEIFTLSDIKVGDIVKGTILDINRSGILVKIGNIRAFVTNEHISNVRYSDNIKTKFKIGQTVTGRVWINKDLFNVKLTLKQALVESDICLKSYEEAQVKSQYPGVVVKIISENGALVKFYNEVQGWLKNSVISNAQHNLKQLLYEGQVVFATVLEKAGTRLTLTLDPPKKHAVFDRFRLGEVVVGKVCDVSKDGITVTVESKADNCFVPATHLCSNPDLNDENDLSNGNLVDKSTNFNINSKLKHNRSGDFIDSDLRAADSSKRLKRKNKDKEAKVFLEILKPVLSGVQHFFESDEENKDNDNSSGDEKEQDDAIVKIKKRKLSQKEQVKLVRQQEDYLRKKEEELADNTGLPQTAEQFDRRLLGEPNSSELWAQYIAFHIQATEIDKARAVVQRALKTIQQSATQDRLNIWITYLNLESLYGTKDTFDKVFEEAVRCNDALTVYLETIRILASSLNSKDIDEKIGKARAKFKQEAEMYVEIGKVYYKQKRFVDARKLKDSALRTILDKKKHVPLIVQFAIMEFNEGEENQAEALFETILQSDPRRVDVWCTYIDQLVKRNKIELARKVLDRAVAQKLNYKKMKTLYKKFQNFEQRHGTSETQAHVKILLENYVSQFVDK